MGERRVRRGDFNEIAGAEPPPKPEENGRVFMDAYAFCDEQTEPPVPLLGTPELAVLAAGGLGLLAGRPGTGKTTLVLDLVCHLAAGRAWPPASDERGPTPWPCPRPLRIALVENEGPVEMFRSKLKDKLERFPDDLRNAKGKIVVSNFRWGSFSFADPEVATAAARELDEEAIDLVVGDPLASLGPEGVGSPAETRDFLSALRPLGLGTTRAFLFLHHFRERVERHEDELRKLSGAWGGHLDTLLALASTGHADQAQLTYSKIRWARERVPRPIILGRVWNTASYEAISEEGDVAQLEPLVYGHLTDLRERKLGVGGAGYATTDQIAKAIEHRRADVDKALEAANHLFVLLDFERAKALGSRSKKLWGLKEWDQPLETREQRRLRLVEEPEPLADDEPE